MAELPIHRILWAPSNADHYNHLHVEGAPSKTGTPPASNPGMSQAVQVIYEALRAEFGTPYYFQDPKPPEPCWSHMGWYNRRKISGSNTWSQHAWSNALDIGPYYGQEEQQKFYDFLTGQQPEEPEVSLTDEEENMVEDLLAALKAAGKGTRTSRNDHLGKIVNWVHEADGDDSPGSGLQRGDTVTLT